MNKILMIIIAIFCLHLSECFSQTNRIMVNGQALFFSGMNMAWGSFARDATYFNSDPAIEPLFIQALDEISENGGNSMRWWVHVNGRYSPVFTDGKVSGLTTEIENIRRILDLAYERKMLICLSLWSHDMLTDGGQNLDDIEAMLEDSASAHAYVENALIPLVQGLKGHPGIACWEIFNEPEGMLVSTGWTTRRTTIPDIQRFVNICAGAIHRTDSTALVTNGTHKITYNSDIGTFTNNYDDDLLIAAGGDSLGYLDFYQVHYYSNFSSSENVFGYPYSHWELDKPLVVGEFAAKGPNASTDPLEAYQWLYQQGYAGGWSWTWTGHDGYGGIEEAAPGMQYLYDNYPSDIIVRNPGIILSFSADSLIIAKGDSVALMWNTSDSSEVMLNGFSVEQNDTVYVSPDSTTTYKLIAASPLYSDSSEITITVLYPGSIVYFTATPQALELGESSTLAWSVIDSALVTLNGDVVLASDLKIITPVNDTTFTLRTYGAITDSASVRITVLDVLAINRALNKPAYASSTENTTGVQGPFATVDGNYLTRWSSDYPDLSDAEADSQWIYIDLLGFYDIARVELYWEDAYGESYRIEISDNARTWTTVSTVTGGDGGADVLDGLSGTGRFVRMKGVNRGTQWGYSLYEFEVYGYPVEDIIVTEYIDNFEDGFLNGWKADHPETFGLSESDGVLTITYNRTGSSGIWDNFNLTPIGKIDASGFPYITVKIKSTIATQVTFKPIYESGDDWLQKNVPGDDTWRWYTFNLTGLSSTPISIIYMYFDGGSTDVKSGIVQFDDLHIGVQPTAIDEPSIEAPIAYELGNAFPNPFNPKTKIKYSIPNSDHVKIEVYNVLGQHVKSLVNEYKHAGQYIVEFDGMNLPSGVYFYTIRTNKYTAAKKMILMK
ncbi:MAG: discoidin domain-containing protein [Calditrichaceae bacterium]|nr:discoidin domain-containing protein [Calditrichaceae bacterium]MBN2708594.1 discoidin domain-containing protein [Calditrichaceae bacterium]RQV95446.1 MAG: T9SS C-terminal target domain-containing protein [Calditrichota bacterium]